jgi:hypothetical protein
LTPTGSQARLFGGGIHANILFLRRSPLSVFLDEKCAFDGGKIFEELDQIFRFIAHIGLNLTPMRLELEIPFAMFSALISFRYSDL